MRQLEPDDNRHLHVQIADAIRQDVIDGLYPPGAPLPSRKVTAEEFGVAPMTIGNAWRILRDEGVIVSRQGSGVYVRQVPGKARDPLAEIDELRALVNQLRDHIDELDEALRRRDTLG